MFSITSMMIRDKIQEIKIINEMKMKISISISISIKKVSQEEQKTEIEKKFLIKK